MSILDSILGGALGHQSQNAGGLQSVLGQILGGGGPMAGQARGDVLGGSSARTPEATGGLGGAFGSVFGQSQQPQGGSDVPAGPTGGLAGAMGSVFGMGAPHPTQSSGGLLGGLMEAMRSNGLGPQADSWVGNGPNQPVSPDQLQNVFGQERVQQWSQQTGMSTGGLLGALSSVLPQVVHHMTPTGKADEAINPFER
jgi:uncharacterized protein YidB (DUF937 family)